MAEFKKNHNPLRFRAFLIPLYFNRLKLWKPYALGKYSVKCFAYVLWNILQLPFHKQQNKL